MFYSQVLLSRNGPLGPIWVAAICGMKSLKKDQIARTDISSSVDKILPEIGISYRIVFVAQLLLGVVRIFSKKVDYLYDYCNEVVKSIEPMQQAASKASTGRSSLNVKQVKEALRARRVIEATTPTSNEDLPETMLASVDHPTIIIPKILELASFDLGIAEERDATEAHHQLANQDNWEGEQHHASSLYELKFLSMGQCYQRVTVSCAEFDAACFTPVHDVLPPEMMDIDLAVRELSNLSRKRKRPEGGYQNMDENGTSACSTHVQDVPPLEMMEIDPDLSEVSHLSQRQEQPGGDDQNVGENGSSLSFGTKGSTTQESEKKLHLDKANVTSSAGFEEGTIEEEKSLNPPVLHQRKPSRDEKAASIEEVCLAKANMTSSVGFEADIIEEDESLKPSVLHQRTPSRYEKAASIVEVHLDKANATSSIGFGEQILEEEELLELPVLQQRTQSKDENTASTAEVHLDKAKTSCIWSREHIIEEEGLLEPPLLHQRTPLKDEKATSIEKSLKAISPGAVDKYSLPCDSGCISPKFMVRTPAKIERHRIGRKRKALLDKTIVLSNETLRQLIHDASSLVCQRRRAPHTSLDAWRETRINYLLETFMDPLIPYMSTQQQTHLHTSTPETSERCHVELVNARKHLSDVVPESRIKGAGNTEGEGCSDDPRTNRLDEQENDVQTPAGSHLETDNGSKHLSDEVSECNGSFKERGMGISETECQSEGWRTNRLDELKSDTPSLNEALSATLDNIDEDLPSHGEHSTDEDSAWSMRTRKTASHLCEVFRTLQKHTGKNSLNLTQVLEGRKRKTSARFFYETLILKGNGFIDVKQEAPYCDIIISANPQLEAEFRKVAQELTS